MMRYIELVFILLIFSSCKVWSLSNNSGSDKNIYIEFQDFFVDDIISVKINNCLIVENKLINSDQVTGYTGFNIVLIDSTTKVAVVGDVEKALPCLSRIRNKFKLMIYLNGKEVKIFDIDVNNGNYIGFSKGKENVVLYQSKTPFEYE